MQLPYDQASKHLNIYPREVETNVHTKPTFKSSQLLYL